MKSLIILLSCILVGCLAKKCKHSFSNIKGKDDLSLTDENCNDDNEQYCVKMTGYDTEQGDSKSFIFRGCYSDLQIPLWYNYYNPGKCPADGDHFTSSDKKVTGSLYCCEEDNCNPSSKVSTSFILLSIISIFALFYSSFSFAC